MLQYVTDEYTVNYITYEIISTLLFIPLSLVKDAHFHLVPRLRMLEQYLHSLTRLRGVVLNPLSTGSTLSYCGQKYSHEHPFHKHPHSIWAPSFLHTQFHKKISEKYPEFLKFVRFNIV
jgi:hypothetical protein